MSPEQEQIIALASVVQKLKDNNLKLSTRFKTSPTGKDKGKCKVKGKVKGQKQAGKQSQYGKGNEEWNRQDPKDGEANTKKVNGKN